eukprot:365949-Chlamydomonas_euryale.AAC.8
MWSSRFARQPPGLRVTPGGRPLLPMPTSWCPASPGGRNLSRKLPVRRSSSPRLLTAPCSRLPERAALWVWLLLLPPPPRGSTFRRDAPFALPAGTTTGARCDNASRSVAPELACAAAETPPPPLLLPWWSFPGDPRSMLLAPAPPRVRSCAPPPARTPAEGKPGKPICLPTLGALGSWVPNDCIELRAGCLPAACACGGGAPPRSSGTGSGWAMRFVAGKPSALDDRRHAHAARRSAASCKVAVWEGGVHVRAQAVLVCRRGGRIPGRLRGRSLRQQLRLGLSVAVVKVGAGRSVRSLDAMARRPLLARHAATGHRSRGLGAQRKVRVLQALHGGGALIGVPVAHGRHEVDGLWAGVRDDLGQRRRRKLREPEVHRSGQLQALWPRLRRGRADHAANLREGGTYPQGLRQQFEHDAMAYARRRDYKGSRHADWPYLQHRPGMPTLAL